MSFEKIKAMRNAERFLSQGKIRLAINEYQKVVENDPKDFSTLNILGDLHAKNNSNKEAVGCFTKVAEYYGEQGFFQKAIAVYNKIFRIEPNSMEITAKLAYLYHMKGSVAEARKHYKSLADYYQKNGRKIEALEVRKQLAELDPNNTEIYLTIAESFYQEGQPDEAATSFTEAGLRFNKQGKYESSLTAFTKALEIKKDDLRTLNGLVKAQIALGDADEAARTLEKVVDEQPYNRDVLSLLTDCYLEADNPADAEKTIFKLIEQEPTNHAKFLELVELYLKNNDLESAGRILTHSAEHLLIGGQAEKMLEWTNEILARNPERTDALRILVQYYGWQRNPEALKKSLDRLLETAREIGDSESERFALSHIVLTDPQAEKIKRLQELNTLHGFEPEMAPEAVKHFEIPTFETFTPTEIVEESNDFQVNNNEISFADLRVSEDFESNEAGSGVQNDSAETNFYTTADYDYGAITEVEASDQNYSTPPKTTGGLKLSDEHKLQREVESIEFYIEQGYQDLAAKSLDELEANFGMQPQVIDLRARLHGFAPQSEIEIAAEIGISNEEPMAEILAFKELKTNNIESLDDLRNDFDFEEGEDVDLSDRYETHYHHGDRIQGNGIDGSRNQRISGRDKSGRKWTMEPDGFFNARIFWDIALWKKKCRIWRYVVCRSLEVPNLNDEEKHAFYYEIGNAL